MRKAKNTSVGALVRIPTRIIFPGRRNPYEYENGVVIGTGKNKNGTPVIHVNYFDHFRKTSHKQWVLRDSAEEVTCYGKIGGKEEFEQWLKTREHE